MIACEMLGVTEDLCTLHMRKIGMKSVRAAEKLSRRRDDHTRSRGNEHKKRPVQSPMLKTKKCTALKSRGCVAGLVGWIEIVIGGNTAYGKGVST